VPGLGGIDHFVDLEHGSDRDRLAVGIELRDFCLVVLFALDRVFDGFHFLAETEPDIAFQPMPPNSPVGHATVKKEA